MTPTESWPLWGHSIDRMADDTPEERPDDFFSALPMFGDLAKASRARGR